jgi:hypothetical protein
MTRASFISESSFTGWIGVAQEDITPSVGIYARNWGAAIHDQAEGIHRPLTLTAITFQSECSSQPLVLLSADLGWWQNFRDAEEIGKKILEEFELPVANLMFSLTHTHSGPSISTEDKDRPGGHFIQPYLNHLATKSINAIRRALSSKKQSTLSWSYGSCPLAKNRDLPDPSKNRVVNGYNPNEKADHTLLVGRVTDLEGKIIATMVNYACHPTTLAWQNRLISPDFPGAMRELVESHTENAPCLFLQGASGELGSREQYVGDTAIADAHGRELGYSVLGTLESMLPPKIGLQFSGVVESGASLACWNRVSIETDNTCSASLEYVAMQLKTLPSLAEIEEKISLCKDRVQGERLKRARLIRKRFEDEESANIPVWIWKLGKSFLIAHENEAYSNFQTSLRSSFPEYPIAVMNVTNGGCGYLPPSHLYDLDIYQVWQTPFERGSLEKLCQKCEEILTLQKKHLHS